MVIERSENEIIIKIPSNVNIEGLQEIIEYLRYKEILSKSKATAEDIEELADEVNKSWWNANREKLGL